MRVCGTSITESAIALTCLSPSITIARILVGIDRFQAASDLLLSHHIWDLTILNLILNIKDKRFFVFRIEILQLNIKTPPVACIHL